ncbi:MAG: hypothetical protein ACR2MG_16370 [Pyrinomonadaceae bacterium]
MRLLSPVITFLTFAAILGFAVWQDSNLLFQSPVSVGIDGYYYVLQVNSLREFGHLYFPTNLPLVLYFLTAISFLTSDAIFAVKLGAIILQVLLCLGAAALLQTTTKNAWLAAFGVFLIAFSVLHLYFLSEFLSNLGALMCLIWSAFGIIRTLQTKKKPWLVFSGLMLFAAILSHRSAFGLIILISFAVLFAYLWLNYTTNTKQRFIFGLIILLLLVSPFVLAWQTLFTLPIWLSSELSKYPQNPFRSLNLMESLMLLIASGATLIILCAKPEVLRKSLSGLILLSIVVWSLLVTLNPFLNHQTGITGIVARLDALAYLQAAIAIPLLLSLLFPYSKKFAFVVVGLLLPLLILRLFAPLPLGLRTEYLQTREKLIRELSVMRRQICEKPFIIAPHGEQFLIMATIGVPSQQKPPLENQYQCVFWLIHQPETDYQTVFDKSITSSDGDFTLVEDSEMKRVFEMMSIEESRALVSKNSHLKFLSNQSTR